MPRQPKPLLKLTSGELTRLNDARDLMLFALIDNRVQGESKEAAALRSSLRDCEQIIYRIIELSKLPA